MPRCDGTGPRGQGPMTGWGNGYCAVRISSPQQEIDYLRRQTMALRRQLSIIRIRLEELSAEKEEHHARV